MMATADLPMLNRAIALLISRPQVSETIRRLRSELRESAEPFVWSAIELNDVSDAIPPAIQSAWIFVLKADCWSGAHFHPNSVQHMAIVSGRGRYKIGRDTGEMSAFGAGLQSSDPQWYVIDPSVPHEFCPSGGDMVVLSFHTASAGDLIEVSTTYARGRRYAQAPV